jgi:hypothetical protein
MQSFSTIYLEGGLPFPFFNLRTLEVHNGLRKSEIPGIVCLLKNAPLLDTLKLEFVHCDECMLTRRSDDVSIKHNLILLSFILVWPLTSAIYIYSDVISEMGHNFIGRLWFHRRTVLGIWSSSFKILPKSPKGVENLWYEWERDCCYQISAKAWECLARSDSN